MTIADLIEWCTHRSACEPAILWLGELDPGRPAYDAWRACDRGDWLIWLAGEAGRHRAIGLAACDCAEAVLRFVPPGEARLAEAIRVARARHAAKATTSEARVAAYAAAAAAAAVRAHVGARDATYHAARAADAAAFCAAHCADHYAAYAASDADCAAGDLISARIVRRRIAWRDVRDAIFGQASPPASRVLGGGAGLPGAEQ